jgi:hypothetical protein
VSSRPRCPDSAIGFSPDSEALNCDWTTD